MKSALLTSPINSISSKPASHRSAEAHIYEDILDYLDYEVTIDYAGKESDYDQYDEVFVYHGNEWGGSLNLFGGMDNKDLRDRISLLSNLDVDKVSSVVIDFPEYERLFKERLQRKPLEMWDSVNWENLKLLESCETWNGIVREWNKYVIGDSHAISMYRRGYNVRSIPFKTLHGAMKMGFEELFKEKFGWDAPVNRVEFYFGNIDIRHHFCRMKDPVSTARETAGNYALHAIWFGQEFGCDVGIYEPLPIEHPSRKIPKSGHYKGEPFHGTWEERNKVRNAFIDEIKKYESVELIEWTANLMNDKGELDFGCMEKPQSVHLSRDYYPWWQGLQKEKANTLDSFM